MKKKLLLTVVLIACMAPLIAQTHERITLEGGDDLSKALSGNGLFRFPQFTNGTVTLRNGKKISAAFNYNELSGEMEFIGEKGDTLILGAPESLVSIIVGETMFFYDNGYLEAIAGNDSLRLARKQKIKLQAAKVGGYGEESQTSAIDNFQNFFVSGEGSLALTLNQKTIVIKDNAFFWIGKDQQILPATKDNLLKLTDKRKQDGIEQYVKKNRINFNIQKDLIKLIGYCLA